MLNLAAGTLDESGLTAWLRANVKGPLRVTNGGKLGLSSISAPLGLYVALSLWPALKLRDISTQEIYALVVELP